MTLFNRHIRMTASEIAMGRYLRAPDHPAADDFSAAFDQAALEEAVPKEGEANGAGGASGDGAAGAPVDEGAGGGDTGAAAGDGTATPPAADGEGAAGGEGTPPAAGTAAETPPAEGAAPAAGGDGAGDAGGDAGTTTPTPAAGNKDADDILKRLAAEVAKQPPAVAAEPPAAAEAPTPAETPVFSADEQATLDKFQEDWPDVATAMTLRSRELGRGVVEYIFNQIAPEVRQIKDLVQTLALRAHHGDLVESIGDYSNEEVDAIKGWINQQPAYLQPAYSSVIEQGTAEEVADLVNRYREVTGKQPASTPAATPEASRGDTELSDEAKKAALGLAPVGSKRSVVPKINDASSFDDGWAQFADAQV